MTTMTIRRFGAWRIAFLLAFLGFGAGWWIAGPEQVFGLWGFRVLQPPYEDARGITAAIESANEGFEPWVENPNDPWGRIYNYPRIWLKLGALGLDTSHTAAFAAVLTVLFFAGLLLFPPRNTGWADAVLILLVAFSPAAMLGVKAGNTDQGMFFLLSLAVVGISSSRRMTRAGGIAAVLAGFLLKIYPILGMAACARFGRRTALLILAGTAAVVATYGFLHWDETSTIRKATPFAGRVSYGKDVFWMRAASEFPALAGPARVASWAGAILGCCLVPAGAYLQNRRSSPALADHRTHVAFLVGAAVYGGTFLMGSNWDYRLLMLAFTVPGLLAMAGDKPRAERAIAITTLCAVVFACWSTMFWNLSRHIPGGSAASVVLDEAGKWLVFLGLCLLSGRCVPWLAQSILRPAKQP